VRAPAPVPRPSKSSRLLPSRQRKRIDVSF